MFPVERLISEHRLIEQMVELAQREIKKIDTTHRLDLDFIVVAVDFFRTYADRFHHGKEEGILFKELSSKKLSDADHRMMLDLINDHAFARKTVNNLEISARRGETSETRKNVAELLRKLVALYPKHIQKEDSQFFFPSMKYFTQKEKEKMLARFLEFDGNFTYKRYEKIVTDFMKELDRRSP